MSDTERYNDIIHLPHSRSKKHTPMSNYDRAAQFSPFAALKGYEDEIEETARFTEGKTELDESQRSAINDILVALKARESERPQVRVTCFVADGRKAGGAYRTFLGRVKRVDARNFTLVLEEHVVPFEDVVEIELL